MGLLLNAWQQGDGLACDVCVLLPPHDWRSLRVAHSGLRCRLGVEDMRRLFSLRLRAWMERTTPVSPETLFREDGTVGGFATLLTIALRVDVLTEVLRAIAANSKLVDPGLAPVRQVLAQLRRLVVREKRLAARERSGRKSTLQRRMLRKFADFAGLIPLLVSLFEHFPLKLMPSCVFVDVCEVSTSLIHNAQDCKRDFLAAGGLCRVLNYLRAQPCHAEAHAAGLAVLLALSARSEPCIRLLAEIGAHQVVLAALQRFPGHEQVVARATGVLANMSNVPCVCPILQKSGALRMVQSMVRQDGPHNTPFMREFIQYALQNVERRDGT